MKRNPRKQTVSYNIHLTSNQHIVKKNKQLITIYTQYNIHCTMFVQAVAQKKKRINAQAKKPIIKESNQLVILYIVQA